jgi:hypothetical protein
MIGFATNGIMLPPLMRITVFIALSLGMIAATTEIGRAQSVVDAFQAWQRMKCAGDAVCLTNAYRIEKRGTKHVASGGEFSAVVRTVVDGVNGYLMIDDEGTGGGNGVTETAIFRPVSGLPLFVVVTRVYETLQVQNGTVEIYRWDSGALIQATGLFPKPEPRDFVPGADAARATGFARGEDEWKETVLHLPRKGQTIDAYLLRFDVERCVKEDWMGQPESVRVVICAAAAKIHLPHMTIVFDKTEGVFRRGFLSNRKAPTLR